jgi:hypothetical protein
MMDDPFSIPLIFVVTEHISQSSPRVPGILPRARPQTRMFATNERRGMKKLFSKWLRRCWT